MLTEKLAPDYAVSTGSKSTSPKLTGGVRKKECPRGCDYS
jgi:hypothetical protein